MPVNSIWMGNGVQGLRSGICFCLPCLINLLVLPPDPQAVDAPHEFMHLVEPGFLIFKLIEESLH